MKKFLNSKGIIIIVAFLTLGILLILAFYFLNFTLLEYKISKNYLKGASAYYLAEAGVNDAIWRLKNDSIWGSDFIDPLKNPYNDGTFWSASFSSEGVLGGSYTVSIQNTAMGRGNITSVAIIPLGGGKTAQRIVKTTVFKGLDSPIGNNAIFTGGSSENIRIISTFLKINKGNLFSNHNLEISGESNVSVYDDPDTEDELEGKILASHNFSLKNSPDPITTAICARDYCTENCEGYIEGSDSCPPDPVALPIVDFDSSSSNSFKSRAQSVQNLGQCEVLCQQSGQDPIQCSDKCIFTSKEFEDLLWDIEQGGTLILNNDITYITGSLEVLGGRHLFINGTLVVDDNIRIGERYKWNQQEGNSQITIIQPGPQKPSGLLTKRKIDIGAYAGFQEINIEGIIYANDEISMVSVPQTFNVVGGIIGRKVTFISLWQWLNVTLDKDKILYGLGYLIDGSVITPTYSPIITIEHWEESY